MTKRVAISLPDDLFRQIEHSRARVGKDRSTWIQEAASEYLQKRTRDEEIEAYFQGYERTPLTKDELSQIRWNESHFGVTLSERVARPKRKGARRGARDRAR